MAKPIHNSDALTAFLDQGSTFEGTLSFQGSVRIDGVFKGDIVQGNMLVLGDKAEVEGTISVDEVVISGRFKGTIKASKNLVIKSPAVVAADISAPSLSIDQGAVFDGTIAMSSNSSNRTAGQASDGQVMSEAIAKQKGLS